MLQRWLLALTCALSVACGNRIFVMDDIQDWEEQQIMQLQITASEGVAVFDPLGVLPLTTAVGLNQSDQARQATNIAGNLLWVTTTNYNNISVPDAVAYLSCDDNANSSNISPGDMLTGLMDNGSELKAILLYSIVGNCCGLEDSNPRFQSIFTMIDSGEAIETLRQAKAAPGRSVRAVITGSNSTSGTTDSGDAPGGSNSAVAMSILYSITGLITLLFLIIIATGAVRAHRYPERYGPRAGNGGRARQSRAKGLARAVLDTIPIVKFGAPAPPKDDPAVELESQASVTDLDVATGARLSAIHELPRQQSNRSQTATPPTTEDPQAAASTAGAVAGDAASMLEDPYLGCSICTEDFKVGEDVRVLPCNHKFHPNCIDPWLVDVSGTCPLCRLDLRPHNSVEEETTDDASQLPPPLEHEAGEGSEQPNAQRATRRSSRLLDLHRLRHASVEERLEILRRHRSQQREASTGPDYGSEAVDSQSHHTTLSNRLRDRFRIKTTRTQQPPAPR